MIKSEWIEEYFNNSEYLVSYADDYSNDLADFLNNKLLENEEHYTVDNGKTKRFVNAKAQEYYDQLKGRKIK